MELNFSFFTGDEKARLFQNSDGQVVLLLGISASVCVAIAFGVFFTGFFYRAFARSRGDEQAYDTLAVFIPSGYM